MSSTSSAHRSSTREPTNPEPPSTTTPVRDGTAPAYGPHAHVGQRTRLQPRVGPSMIVPRPHLADALFLLPSPPRAGAQLALAYGPVDAHRPGGAVVSGTDGGTVGRRRAARSRHAGHASTGDRAGWTQRAAE